MDQIRETNYCHWSSGSVIRPSSVVKANRHRKLENGITGFTGGQGQGGPLIEVQLPCRRLRSCAKLRVRPYNSYDNACHLRSVRNGAISVLPPHFCRENP